MTDFELDAHIDNLICRSRLPVKGKRTPRGAAAKAKAAVALVVVAQVAVPAGAEGAALEGRAGDEPKGANGDEAGEW